MFISLEGTPNIFNIFHILLYSMRLNNKRISLWLFDIYFLYHICNNIIYTYIYMINQTTTYKKYKENCIVMKIIIKKIYWQERRWKCRYWDLYFLYINRILYQSTIYLSHDIEHTYNNKNEQNIIKLMMPKLWRIYLENVVNIENSLSQWKNMSTYIHIYYAFVSEWKIS